MRGSKILLVKGFAALAGLCCCLGAQAAAIEDFYGNWENPASDASGIAYVNVGGAGGRRAHIRIYGDCQPGLCDWGRVPAERIVFAADGKSVLEMSALIHYGFAHRRIVLHPTREGGLRFEAEIRPLPGGSRKAKRVSGILRRSIWAGPFSKAAWEQKRGRNAGWGGGARGVRLRPPTQMCRPFDPLTIRMGRVGKDWTISAKAEVLIRSRHDRAKLDEALAALRHFGFDRKCQAGTMEFWKKADGMPSKALEGSFCQRFSSNTAHVTKIGRSWRVVDAGQTIADLKSSRDNAYAVLALIRQYRLGRKCVIGWPDPVMIYWLAAED